MRIAYAADLPTPDEVDPLARRTKARPSTVTSAAAMAAARCRDAERRVRRAAGTRRRAARRAASSVAGRSTRSRASSMPQPESPALAIGSFEELVALATDKRDLQIKAALERDVRLVALRGRPARNRARAERGDKTLVNELSRKLSAWTGRNWMVVVSREQGAPTLKAQADAREAELKRGVRARSAGAGGAGALSGRRDRGGASARRRRRAGRAARRDLPPPRPTTSRKVGRWPISWA